MKTTLITLVGAFLASTCTAAAIENDLTQVEDGILPHPMGKMGTIIEVNGEEKFIEGWDLEDINDIALATYGVSIFTNETTTEPAPEGNILEKRDSQNCNVYKWGLVSHIGVSNGQQTLGKVNRCIVQARQCIRTTCHGDSAIVWCNDNRYALNYPCSTIGGMSFKAQYGCVESQKQLPYPGLRSTQRFHSNENWNVILSNCGNFKPGGQPVKA